MSPQGTTLGRIGGPSLIGDRSAKTDHSGFYRPEDNAHISNYRCQLDSFSTNKTKRLLLQLLDADGSQPNLPETRSDILNYLEYSGPMSFSENGMFMYIPMFFPQPGAGSGNYYISIVTLELQRSYDIFSTLQPHSGVNTAIQEFVPRPTSTNPFLVAGVNFGPDGSYAFVLVQDEYDSTLSASSPYFIKLEAPDSDAYFNFNERSDEWTITEPLQTLALYVEKPISFRYGDDYNKIYVLKDTDAIGNSGIAQFNLGTRGDVDSSSFIHAGTTSFTLDNDYKDFHFSSNGKYLYLLGNQTKLIYQYELSTPWDISTASLDKKMHFGYNTGNDLYDKSMFMHPDGMTMWIYSIQNASEVNVVSAGSYKPVGTRTHLYPNHPNEYFLHNNASVRIHKIIR